LADKTEICACYRMLLQCVSPLIDFQAISLAIWRTYFYISQRLHHVLVTLNLDDHGLLVFAENTAQRVGDFSHRSIGLDSAKNGGEKILRGAGAAL
jgi:hypothetical protein